jgi:hypothetical protein
MLIMALVLSFSVIGLEQFLYTAPVQFQASPGSEVLRWATDALIALPLFALGVWAGQWIASRRGIGLASGPDVARRAVLIAVSVAIAMVPGWFAHNWLNSLTQSEPLVPAHVHGKRIGANVHWVSDPVVFALLLVPLLALAGWGGYLIARRLSFRRLGRLRVPRAADIAVRASLIAAGLAAAPAVAWVLQKGADLSNSAQVYYTSALLSVHVHSHVLFQNGRIVPLPKGPPITPAPYAFAYQVAHAFQDGIAGQAIGLPVAALALLWVARRLARRRGRDAGHALDPHVITTSPMEVAEQ